MRPGLTCLWQVSGRNDLTFNEWMKLDLEYIDTWSLALDLAVRSVPSASSILEEQRGRFMNPDRKARFEFVD